MNIHEYQAKIILRDYGAPVSKGIVIFSLEEIEKKINQLTSNQFVLKAQIHAGGRGKAGGVKLVKSIKELKDQAKDMFGKILKTHQENDHDHPEVKKSVPKKAALTQKTEAKKVSKK